MKTYTTIMKFGAYILIILSAFTFSLSGYKLIASIINTESGFNKKAKSNKGAIGLMQIKIETANYLNQLDKQENITEDELFNPVINIEYGCKYLNYLLKKFEDTNTALAAYNAGETRVRTWLKTEQYSINGKSVNYIPYKETRNYINKINKDLKYYKKLFNN